MTKTDIGGLMRLSDIAAAFGLLTRLPIPVDGAAAAKRGGAAAWAYPLVGAVTSGLAVLVGFGALALGLPATVAALLIIATQIILTGAMHEDGLADCADGFWGGWTPARRLEIMKDSQIGTYGVLALVLALSLRWMALSALLAASGFGATLIVAGLLSGAAMISVMAAMGNARATGLSRSVGQPSLTTASLGGGLALLAGLLLLGASIAIYGGIVIGLAVICAAIAKNKIGGQTGDVLGATQQITEIGVLLTALALQAA